VPPTTARGQGTNATIVIGNLRIYSWRRKLLSLSQKKKEEGKLVSLAAGGLISWLMKTGLDRPTLLEPPENGISAQLQGCAPWARLFKSIC
jgi:hypothetical protein